MPFVFRLSNPGDASAIAEHCQRTLAVPEHSAAFSDAHLHWKYWDPWPFWQGSRSFILLAGEQLIAHAAVVPLRFSRDGRTYTLVQLLDWAADPVHVGAGVTLLKRIAALADGVINVRGSTMTQRILKPLGFRTLGDTYQYAAPIASKSQRVLAHGHASTLRIHSRESFAAREHPLERAQSTADRIVFQRSAKQYQAWLGSPIAPMQYVEVWIEERMAGTFVVCQTPGQARIVDVWVDEQLEGAWETVIQRAYLHSSEQPGALEVVCQSNDAVQMRALEACGFVRSGADPLAILASSTLVSNAASVRHHLLDSDLAYLHHGRLVSWLT